MSYILEALKKAESERERGVVPGLGSASGHRTTYVRQGSQPWWLVVLALGVLLALVAGIWAWRRGAPEVPLAAPQLATAAAAKASAATAGAALPSAKAPSVAVPSATLRSAAGPSSAVAQVIARTPPPVASQSVLAPAPKPSEPQASAPELAKGPLVPVRGAGGGIPLISELPDSLRRQIPVLSISGTVPSPSPDDWILIVNDQVIVKGALAAPEVRLEEVTARSATFNFRGQRFRVEH